MCGLAFCSLRRLGLLVRRQRIADQVVRQDQPALGQRRERDGNPRLFAIGRLVALDGETLIVGRNDLAQKTLAIVDQDRGLSLDQMTGPAAEIRLAHHRPVDAGR